MNDDQRGQHDSGPRMDALSRRKFMSVAAVSGVALTSIGAATEGERMTEEIKKEKIRRAMLAGPPEGTADATVGEFDHLGNLTVLRPGTNEWVCVPGDESIIGKVDMARDPMGMVWFKDLLARKLKPTNTSPGLIYMPNGATQRSFTDPFDTT